MRKASSHQDSPTTAFRCSSTTLQPPRHSFPRQTPSNQPPSAPWTRNHWRHGRLVKARLPFLDLLSAPPSIRLAHVRRRLNGRDELEGGIGDADDANDGTGNDPENVVVEQDAANEDVDCKMLELRPKKQWYGSTHRDHGRGTRTGTMRSARLAVEFGILFTSSVSFCLIAAPSHLVDRCGF
jgi:hypothetical protein